MKKILSFTCGLLSIASPLFGALEISGETWEDESKFGEDGGAIYREDELLGIEDSIFRRNSTVQDYSYEGGHGGAVAVGHIAFGMPPLSTDGWLRYGIHRSIFTSNTATNAGGAIAVGGTLSGGIHDSIFTDNMAMVIGGAVCVGDFYTRNLLEGGIHNSSFTSNTAVMAGGAAVYVGGILNGGIVSSTFTGNYSGGGSWGGGAVSVTTYLNDGIIDSTFTNNTAGRDNMGEYANRAYGGAVSVSIFNGGITSSTFTGNQVFGHGGAVGVYSTDWAPTYYIGDISNSTFSGNTANISYGYDGPGGGNGGAVYVEIDSMRSRIINSTFTNNHADGLGGAFFLDTASMAGMIGKENAITLTADAGKTTLFQGNEDGNGANSFYFGRVNNGITELKSTADASLTVTGAGTVALLDPIRVDMNNEKHFTFTRDDKGEGGKFLWGGVNVFTTDADVDFRGFPISADGKSTINLTQGVTTLMTDFSLKAQGSSTDLEISLGAGHTIEMVLSTLEADFRNASLALFDFNEATGKALLIEPNTTLMLSIGDLEKLAESYLFINGYDPSTLDLDRIILKATAGFKAEFAKTGNQVWINVAPVPEPGTWALMLGGLGVLLAGKRLRRRPTEN